MVFKSESLYRVTCELARCVIWDKLVELILLLAVSQKRELELGSILL